MQAFLSRAMLSVALVLAVMLHGVGALADPIVMKIGTPTVNDHQVEWMKMFKTAVEKNSQRRIEVQLYPNSQLGSASRMIEGVQFNSIQGLVIPPEFLVGVDPRYQMIASPAVFSSASNVDRTLNDPGFRAALETIGTPKGLMLVGAMAAAPLQIYMRKPVQKLEDIKGLKIRVLASPIQIKQISSFGGTGVPMPLDQVMPAVQQGAIDGVMLSIVAAPWLKLQSVAKYGTELRQSYVTSVTVIGKTWFDGLPADLQKIVLDASKQADRDIRPWTIAFSKRSYAEWKKGGGEMVELSQADLDEERAKLANVGAETFAGNADATKMYQLMLATAARNR